MATADQIRFAAACALQAEEGFGATYSRRYGRVDLFVDQSHAPLRRLPRNLFPDNVASVHLYDVTPGQWWQAIYDVQHEDLMKTDDWEDAGCAPPACRVAEHLPPRYTIHTPQGAVTTNNPAVAVTMHSALQQVGARPRLQDNGDPRDGIDRIEGERVAVRVGRDVVPVSVEDARAMGAECAPVLV